MQDIRGIAGTLPVLIAPDVVWNVLALYQECSNWCHRWLSGIRPVESFKSSKSSSPQTSKKFEDFSESAGNQLLMNKGERLLWGYLVEISKAYDYYVTSDYLLVHSFLENRVIAALARPSFHHH